MQLLQPDILYTAIIFSLSIGFFVNSIIFGLFMEDRGKYLVPLFAFTSIAITLLIEQPRIMFSQEHILLIPLGSVVVGSIFFYAIHLYTKAKTP